MMKLHHSLVGAAVILITLLDGGWSYSCPKVGNNPKPVTVPPKKVVLRRSAGSTLCTLVRVKHADPTNTSEVIITNNSPGKDFIIEPVARSYNKRPWERVQGPYLGLFKVRRCAKKKCITRLNRAGKYFLMTSQHVLPTFDAKLARFFMQTTFGPTRDMLMNWNYPSNNKGMAQWVKDQTLLPATKHREYFRRHAAQLSHNNTIGDLAIAVQHPCDPYSRWRRIALASYDLFQYFEVVNFGGRHLIVINGVARTLVDNFTNDIGTISGPGQYQFCWITLDIPGGRVEFRRAGDTSCTVLEGGNPPISLTSSAIALYGQSLSIINLPGIANFERVEPVSALNWGQFWLVMEVWKLNRPNGLFQTHASECQLDSESFPFVVGRLPNNEYMFFSGLATPLENTVTNPLSDGGLSAANDGASMCSNVAKNDQNIESCYLASSIACESSAYSRSQWDTSPQGKENVVVCGSEGEVATDFNLDTSDPKFSTFGHHHNMIQNSLSLQLQAVPYMIYLNAEDQLRQRMAFALSQILVVTPNQVDNDDRETEIYFNYYDIFVRHAFGNYRDILKEVSYSPMMAEMLSFLESRSASFVLQNEGRVSRPDENYAREIMQLFSIGLYQLNIDGTLKKKNKLPVSSYDNSDIQTFARAWTGFRRQNTRFNRDGYRWMANRMDPMAVDGRWRDAFPKLDLNENFIGDGYPLCSELPQRHFLRKGATYRLAGSQTRSEFGYENPYMNFTEIERFQLDSNSNLHEELCNANQPGGACNYLPVVRLGANLNCVGAECDVDNLSMVQMNDGVKYEYVRPACVQHSFHNDQDLNKIVDRHRRAMCLPKNNDDVSMNACCLTNDPAIWWDSQYADYFCEFSFERSTYDTAQSRCQNHQDPDYPNPDTCDWRYIRYWRGDHNDRIGCLNYIQDWDVSWHWTNQTCSIMTKVNGDGLISIVHDPNLDINVGLAEDDLELQTVHLPVSPDNINYFKVKWSDTGEFPSSSNQCANGACQTVGSDCLCNIDVTESSVFSAMPTIDEVISELKIGHSPPDTFDSGTFNLENTSDGVSLYSKNGESLYSKHSIFGVQYRGEMTYFKNMVSTVSISGSTGGVNYQFRNPPQFLSIAKPDTRDAIHETEAVLDHYFYHTNTAPFLATRIIKRFGISNPSPRYIKAVAQAFTRGTYSKAQITFGDGRYGNLEAMIAAIVMDTEARSVALDADPTTGSVREPMVKVMSFFRAMEYTRAANITSVMMNNLQDFIGQEVHATPNVFSFFLPEFAPPGKVSQAALTAPEAQVLDAPKIIGFLNGLFSLVDIGLTNCFGGFSERNSWWCDGYRYYTPAEMYSRGYLGFVPAVTSNSSELVDEMALLLTAGRLNTQSRTILADAYDQELQTNGADSALKVVQKLIVSTPEFHSTNVFENIDEDRPISPRPQPSTNPYKAIVYLNLDGGLDSFNVLIPHSGCQGDTAQNTMFNEYTRTRGDIALEFNTLHTIDASSSGQVCDTFGLHESLPFIKTLFDSNDLTFFANMGVLQQPTTKENWRENVGDTVLFAHNTQQEEINFVDVFDEESGRGVCGRMLDVLAMNGFNPGSISVNGIASSLRSDSSPLIVIDSSGYQPFNPVSTLEVTSDITSIVRDLNKATTLRSSLFGETWSETLFQSLDENELMYEEISNTVIDATFPDTDLGRQLSSVATVMKTKDVRGTDRDIFNVRIGGFDLHSQIAVPLTERLTTINDALEAFVTEMRDHQGIWDDVAVVVVSEFARTMMGNTGNGSDHAWGGHYFVASGSLDGGKILGEFPPDLTNEGDYAFEPGIFIPSRPWESLWNGIAQWFGITTYNDLVTVLPNRNSFSNLLWTQSDLFNTNRRHKNVFKETDE